MALTPNQKREVKKAIAAAEQGVPDYAAAEKKLEGHKFCTYCGLRKPYTDFHKDEEKEDGYRDVCKPCRKGFNKRKEDSKKRRQLAQLEKEGLEALGKMSSGGTFDPHVNEVFEAIMRPFGGVNGYAKHLFATYLSCEPGSTRRLKVHEMILRLADRVTRLGLAERQLDMMEERDLVRLMHDEIVEYQKSNNLPETAIPTMDGRLLTVEDIDGKDTEESS